MIKENYKKPVYTIAIAAGFLKVCPNTLRIWERKGLIKPARLGKNRFYSRYDIDRLDYVKELLQKKHVNIEGVKQILISTHCWEVKKCKPKERKACAFFRKQARA